MLTEGESLGTYAFKGQAEEGLVRDSKVGPKDEGKVWRGHITEERKEKISRRRK